MHRQDSLYLGWYEFGRISLSLDALGTLNATGTIQVEKPNGATIRKAYLMAATTGFTGIRLNAGDVKIQGNDVVWETEIINSISSYNYWADITAIIKPMIDAAPAGFVNLEITESGSAGIDGEILAVIFDDPNQSTDNTVFLYFGAQNVNGDNFVIDFGMPIDKDDPNLILDYSLGISYGCQGYTACVHSQYSTVDINGNRLTSSAGGQDDGETANGALITVGGLGDNNNNPADPNATPVNERSDDELYDLKPFVNDGDTSIQIATANPSNDDNILFAATFFTATRSIVALDVDITLLNNPTTTEARLPYENIINYFADGVYESSNGTHKVGNITFHPSGANIDRADVVWSEKCHPKASPGGIAVDGLHVSMCDIFENGGLLGFDYNYLSSNGRQRMGGYTLAHEWGHYYYTLYDEYVGDTKYDNIFHFPHSTDIAVDNSIMNSHWNAHSILGDNYNWLNFSIAKNDTQQNAQHRVYGASAWDTLTRPVSDDPRNGERVSLPVRVYYPELKDAKPSGNQDAPIDLPGTARSALNIVWTDASDSSPPTTLLFNIPYEVQLTSLLGQNISYPDPILLLAFVHKDAPITDMGVQASVQLPDGSTESVTFTDDGSPPDAAQGDGLYSAILGYEADGIYTIQIEFDNNAGIAKFVHTAFLPAIGEDGPVPLPEPVTITETFTVSMMLQILASNVVSDDYGNTPGEAEALTANNEPLPGKIDYAADKDVFQFTTLGNGITYVRVTNLALGMNPHLRILGPDASTVLFDASHDINEYLFIPLIDVLPNTTVYAEVFDTNVIASGGLYEFSVGENLAGESLISEDSYIYLPIVINQ